MNNDPEVIPVPVPSGNISFGNLAEDLHMAYCNARGGDDPWRAVARRAVQLVKRTLPEVPLEEE